MLLAIDTATQTASIAVYDWQNHHLLGEWTWLARRRQTQDLLSTVQSLLAQLDLAPPSITALAVTTGPGSFTGVRIGVSVVKGIGLGLSQPVQAVGMPVLSITAAPWLPAAQSVNIQNTGIQNNGIQNTGVQVWAYLQAGRGRVNWCVFKDPDLLWRPGVKDHRAGSVDELAVALAASQEPVWLVGEETPDLRAAVHAPVHVTMSELAHVTLLDAVSSWRRAGHLARLAALRLERGLGEDLAALQPLYLQGL